MLGFERLPIEGVRQQHVVVIEDRQRQVRGIALLRMRDDVGRVRPDVGQLQDRLDGDALPGRVEFRPPRDAVDVRPDGLAGEGLELLPGQRERRVDLTPDPEIPARQVRVRHGSVVQDRELVRLVLARWQAGDNGRIALAIAEETLEHP